mmetsp:Transcript_16486/g.34000  ORF Transcript_16486/g.34000 Transcript_16486/m.34000 type:complete len:850 (-) Transcript_16486:67-2616(-)
MSNADAEKGGLMKGIKQNKVIKGVLNTARDIEKVAESSIQSSVRGVKKVGDGVKKATDTTIHLLEDVGAIPPLEKIPLHHFVALLLICIAPAFMFLACFSAMGWGEHGYRFAMHNSDFGYWCAASSVLTFGTMYMLDLSYWTSKCMLTLRTILVSLAVIAFIFGIFFNAAEYPASPLVVTMLALPFYLMSWKYILFFVNFRNYVNWLSTPLFCTATITLIAWMIWMFTDNGRNEWTDKNRDYWAHSIDCAPNFDTETSGFPECAQYYDADSNTWSCSLRGVDETIDKCPSECNQVYNTCGAAFLIWVNPMALSTGFYFLSFVFAFANPDHKDASVGAFVKFFLVICFVMWVATSLAVANSGVADALFSFVVFMCLSAACVALMLLGKKQLVGKIEDGVINKMKEKYGGYGTIFKGTFILSCLPIVFVYWGIATLNQAIRKIGLPLSKPLTDEDRTYALTLAASKQKKMIMSWEWTPVILMSLKVGVVVQVMGVLVTKFTYLFLAWLRVAISEWSIAAVSAAMSVVGISLFLLPPVPGVPIYFMSGLMLLAVCEPTMGLVGGVTYCTFLGLILKLISGTIQQQIFGKKLGNMVAVRQMVGVNSDLMRAVRVVMADPGLTWGKCAILTGGPDWPTFVTTGILGCDFLPVFVGTFPCIVLIIPTVLMGMFVYLEGEPYSYEWARTVGTVATMVTGLAQGGVMLLAAFYLEKTQVDRKDEIDALPLDEEVLAEDKKVEANSALFAQVTRWEVLPQKIKCLLLSALFIMMTSCWLVMVFTTSCFKAFEMSDTIEDALDGDGWSLVKPLGWVSIFLFLIASFQLVAFNKWANKQVQLGKAEGFGKIVDENENNAL